MRKLVAILSLGTTLGTTLVVSSAAAAVLGPVDTYDALKEAIETAQKGDTVKIAAGRIVFPAAIAIDKDLTLEGATDGKTYLWGDPMDDDYWFINGADPGKGKQTKIWNATRGEINDLESVTNAYYRQGSNDYFKNNTTNCLNFVGAATNVILRNLVIADFMQGLFPCRRARLVRLRIVSSMPMVPDTGCTVWMDSTAIHVQRFTGRVCFVFSTRLLSATTMDCSATEPRRA